MAPKSSSSSSKKKASAGTNTADVKAAKFKVPTEFITRPHSPDDHGKETCSAYIHPNILSALEIHPGSFCTVNRIGENGILVTARAGDEETHPVNVITLSNTTRSVGNIILGDRLELKKAQKQPPYSTKVTIGSLQGCDILECIEEKVIQKLLDDSGILMPGMIFHNLKTKTGEESIDIVIADAGDDSLPDVSQLDLNSNEFHGDINGQFYLSPPFIFRKGSTRINFTKETQANRKYNLPEPISYSAVGGLNKEIESLKSAIDIPLHQPALFSSFGVSPPRGILLHGPPGTGKTMLLRVVANTSNAHVLTINGPSIVSKYLGETEAALRDIFNEARKYQPSIVFIDEIDSIAPNRANDDSGEVESRVVATLLTLMDGMGAAGRLVVIAATNRPNSVDPALRRPGRFDQEVEIGIPDVDARFDILTKQFLRMSPDRHVLDSEGIKLIASKTHGYVGADLTALCRESVMKTIQRGLGTSTNIDKFSLKVTLKDVENAMVDIRPSAMREIFLEMPKVYWSDIGGQEELKTKMKEMIQLPLEASETFARLGISAPKGVLLYGPPGCSKTLTAKALATESGINFLAVKGPEVFNKYVGESERAIREIFRKARSAAPSIIFFDEIDALSPDRDGGSTSAASHVLTSLLNEIDGVEELKGVVIVAATNRPDEIDAALLRPGRLDRHIYVGPPDINARLEIFKKCTKKFNIEESGVDLDELANRTDGYSGAEVVLLCQEAGLAAIMEDLDVTKVELRHFEKAFEGIAKGITPEMLSYYESFALRSGSSS
ncbi:afg2p [Saccharomyces arboricola H-6]|uniref:Afg2p n=1 Tax=Saccharomyces arboricola (strain H-6 / AS 2.3317 / CBS 10644) TaxID=1160507 RepID=J8PZ45_SACAR|nr:afg2p [Saccharomyces arboricola H-6]